ncbi:MAG: hypothetical protein N2169_07365, partial [bacterium]|nr:hypothetical protein [bacterium]
MKNFEFFLGGRVFLILALVFVLLSFGHFFKEVWNILGFLPKLIFSALLGFGFITSGYLVKERVQKIFSEVLTSTGFSILFITNFVAKYYNAVDLGLSLFLHICIIVLLLIFSVLSRSVFLMFVSVIGGYFPIFFFGVSLNSLFLLTYITLLNFAIFGISVFRGIYVVGYTNFVSFLLAFLYTYLSIVVNLKDYSLLLWSLFFTVFNFFIFLVSIIFNSVINKTHVGNTDQRFIFWLNIVFYFVGIHISFSLSDSFIWVGLYNLFLFIVNIVLYGFFRSYSGDIFLSLALIYWVLIGFSWVVYDPYFNSYWLLVLAVNSLVFSVFSRRGDIFLYNSLALILSTFWGLFIYLGVFGFGRVELPATLGLIFMVLACLIVYILNYDKLGRFSLDRLFGVFVNLVLFTLAIVWLSPYFRVWLGDSLTRLIEALYFFIFAFPFILFIISLFSAFLYTFPTFVLYTVLRNSFYIIGSLGLAVFNVLILSSIIFNSYMSIVFFLIFLIIVLPAFFLRRAAEIVFGINDFFIDVRYLFLGIITVLGYVFMFSVFKSINLDWASILYLSSALLAVLASFLIILYDYIKVNFNIDEFILRITYTSLFVNSIIFIGIMVLIQLIGSIFNFVVLSNLIPFINQRFISFLLLIGCSAFLMVRSSYMMKSQSVDVVDSVDVVNYNNLYNIDYKNLYNISIVFFNIFVLLGIGQEIEALFYKAGFINGDIFASMFVASFWLLYSACVIYLGIRLNNSVWKTVGFLISLLAILKSFGVMFEDIGALYKSLMAFIMG